MALTQPKKVREIDWQELRGRLSSLTFGEGRRSSPQQVRDLLDERARHLARIPARPPEAGEVLEVLTFTLAGERYALAAVFVHAVYRPDDIAAVPGVPDTLKGLLNLRGQIVPLFDLALILGLLATEKTEHTKVLILGTEEMELGIIVDQVLEVAGLRRSAILEPSPDLAMGCRDLLQGVLADGLIVLHGAALLADPRFVIAQSEFPATLPGGDLA